MVVDTQTYICGKIVQNTHTIQIYTHANEYKQSWKNLNKTGRFFFNVNNLVIMLHYNLWAATFRGNSVKGTWDLSYLLQL